MEQIADYWDKKKIGEVEETEEVGDLFTLLRMPFQQGLSI